MATEAEVGSGPGPFRVEVMGGQFIVTDETTGHSSGVFATRRDAEQWIATQPTPVKSPPASSDPNVSDEKPDTSISAKPSDVGPTIPSAVASKTDPAAQAAKAAAPPPEPGKTEDAKGAADASAALPPVKPAK